MKKPKFFIFENVAGFLNNQTVISDVSGYFQSLKDYKLFYQVLNAKEFGSAQNCKRVVVVGIRKDVRSDFISIQSCSKLSTINEYITKGADYTHVMYDASLIGKAMSPKKSDMKCVALFPHINYLSDRLIYSSFWYSSLFLEQKIDTTF